MTQRRSLTNEAAAELLRLRDLRDQSERDFQQACVDALNHASIREVSRTTGVALSTLQKWRTNLNA